MPSPQYTSEFFCSKWTSETDGKAACIMKRVRIWRQCKNIQKCQAGTYQGATCHDWVISDSHHWVTSLSIILRRNPIKNQVGTNIIQGKLVFSVYKIHQGITSLYESSNTYKFDTASKRTHKVSPTSSEDAAIRSNSKLSGFSLFRNHVYFPVPSLPPK